MYNQNDTKNKANNIQITGILKRPVRLQSQKVIDKLFHIGTINIEQLRAARKLYADYSHANYFNILKSNMLLKLRADKQNYYKLDSVMDTRKRFTLAMNDFNKEEFDIINWTVIHDEYLKYYCAIHSPKTCRAKYQAHTYMVLREALSKLAKFYAISK